MAFRRPTTVITVAVLAVGLLAEGATLARRQPRDARTSVIKDRHLEAWEWLFSQRAYPLGYVPEGAKERALRQIDEAKAKASSSTAPAPLVAVPGDAWVNIGPAPLLDGQVGATGNAGPMHRRRWRWEPSRSRPAIRGRSTRVPGKRCLRAPRTRGGAFSSPPMGAPAGSFSPPPPSRAPPSATSR